jgi:hypothetical protein
MMMMVVAVVEEEEQTQYSMVLMHCRLLLLRMMSLRRLPKLQS